MDDHIWGKYARSSLCCLLQPAVHPIFGSLRNAQTIRFRLSRINGWQISHIMFNDEKLWSTISINVI